jgi:hypothetical protein
MCNIRAGSRNSFIICTSSIVIIIIIIIIITTVIIPRADESDRENVIQSNYTELPLLNYFFRTNFRLIPCCQSASSLSIKYMYYYTSH